jgi:hypothetical protein
MPKTREIAEDRAGRKTPPESEAPRASDALDAVGWTTQFPRRDAFVARVARGHASPPAIGNTVT